MRSRADGTSAAYTFIRSSAHQPSISLSSFMPDMRERRDGHIVNVTSMGDFITMPTISSYCASKFGLEGISEALGKEVAGFGIKVTTLAPGQFRTDWAGRSMDRMPRSIADYDALLALIKAGHPPVRLFLGEDALELVKQKLDTMRAEITAQTALFCSTGFAA